MAITNLLGQTIKGSKTTQKVDMKTQVGMQMKNPSVLGCIERVEEDYKHTPFVNPPKDKPLTILLEPIKQFIKKLLAYIPKITFK